MKPSYRITYCEYCDKVVYPDSPPSKESYENGEIHIQSGSVLLPKSVVKRRHKEGFTSSHAADIDGIYCDYKCLVNYLKQILLIKKDKE